MKRPEVPHINKYAQPTIELVLSLLEQAYQDEYKLDRILKELSDDLLVYPGHEDTSTLKIEKEFNPFMKTI